MANVLIVDDDRTFRTQFRLYVEETGHTWKEAADLSSGLVMARESDFDLVFLDIHLPDGSGLNSINGFKQTPANPDVIIITGDGDPSSAETALLSGAWDYITKPPDYHAIQLLLKRAMEYRHAKQEYAQRRVLKRDFIIGDDPRLIACLEQTARAAATLGSVLITGETERSQSSDASVAMVSPEKTLNTIRRKIIRIVRKVVGMVAEQNGFREVPEIRFAPMNLVSFNEFLSGLQYLYDTGNLSRTDLATAFGYDFQEQVMKRADEIKIMEDLDVPEFAPVPHSNSPNDNEDDTQDTKTDNKTKETDKKEDDK